MSRLTELAIVNIKAAVQATLIPNKDAGQYRVLLTSNNGQIFLTNEDGEPCTYPSDEAAKKSLKRQNKDIRIVYESQFNSYN